MSHIAELQFLTLQVTESTDGIATIEAMASTRPDQAADADAEAQALLDWAHAMFPHGHGAVEDGQDWDHDLQRQEEADGWHTVTLTFSASPAFLAAFEARFGGIRDED